MSDCRSDNERFELIKERLHTPVVGHILNRLGLTRQFLPQPIQPLLPEMKVVRRAMPVLMMDAHDPQKKPFGKLTEVQQKASGENVVRKEIEYGMSSTSAFQKHGIQ